MKSKKIIGFLILSVLLCVNVFAHSGKPKFHVIIDTDGAIDDMRAISMLLAGNDIRVLAITCSQGALLPEKVYLKVNALLAAFHHEGIPVGISEKVNSELPGWNAFAKDVRWAEEMNDQNLNTDGNAREILNNTIEGYESKVTLIALGSLKTYADWIMAHGAEADRIERIIWYNDHSIRSDPNYKTSPDSYEYIKKSGISLEVVSNNSDDLFINQDYLNKIRETNSIYANQIAYVHAQASVVEKINDNHVSLWDDMVPLYLTLPILFNTETEQNIKLVSISQPIPPSFIYETIAKLLLSSTETNNRVFSAFPVDAALYKPEYADILHETIERFGFIEWKAICMTNEIHGHTGIYSIIGAKMGIRAMEYFNVGVNNLEVKTFAGNVPPLSCFNDGVQISTGATLGQGLITISDSVSMIPSAIFTFNGQNVNITLRKEISDQMRKEIKFGIENYGLLTDQYWLYIEELAIKYWADFDRQEIFMIEKK